MDESMEKVGIVVIGLNEGERLRRCLLSIKDCAKHTIYVDSGSVDGSVQLAQAWGFKTLILDKSAIPTAGKARNAGFQSLLQLDPNFSHIQFIDGDCQLNENWLSAAGEELNHRRNVAIVCGHLHEKDVESSIYQRLCELEWRKLPGEIHAAGGIFMIKTEVFQEIGGFDPHILAGEDDEFCFRVRRKGWQILHLDCNMAIHDGGIHRFSQWWKRSMRAGVAYAQGFELHGKTEEKYFRRQCRSIWVWGCLLPLFALLFALFYSLWGLLALLGYPLLLMKTVAHYRALKWSWTDTLLYSIFCVIAKFPGFLGVLKFHFKRLF